MRDRAARSSVRASAMAVHRGTHVALGVHRVAAELAAWPASGGHGRALAGQREHLLAGRPQAEEGGLGRLLLLLLLLLHGFGDRLLELEHHEAPILAVADREPAGAPERVDGRFQLELVLAGALARLLVDGCEDLQDRGREELDLLLLDRDRHEPLSDPRLDEEGALAGFADRPGRDPVDGLELHRTPLARLLGDPSAGYRAARERRRGRRLSSPPVSFTLRSLVAPSANATTVTD